jgi:hypothetical protein
MSRSELVLGLTFLILLAGAVAFGYVHYSPATPQTTAYQSCIYHDTIDESNALTNWKVNQTQDTATITIDRFNVFTPLEEWTINDQPLAWYNSQDNATVLDDRVFGTLTPVDVTNFGPDTPPITVGQLKSTATIQDSDWQKIVLFLVESHIIKTYVHLESDVCLDQATNTPQLYSAHFTGQHTYCTNDCYTKDLNFTVKIDKSTLEITVSFPSNP